MTFFKGKKSFVMNKGLFSLALGTFSLGISEFLMMGILVNLAGAMSVSVSDAGHFISAYATGVCFGAPALLFFRKMPLSKMLMMLAGIIVIGNTCAAVSVNFWTLIVSRFISGLPHGAFFGVGAIVARRLATPGHETSAVSFMIAGMTVATLFGVPLGTFICNTLSWRVAFIIVAVAGTVTFFAIKKWVPFIPALPDHGFRNQFSFLRTLPPWLIFGGVISAQIGLYCWYSYIDPIMTEEAGFSTASLSWIMILAGFGMFAGNLISGRIGDRFKPSSVAAGVMLMGIAVLAMNYFFEHIGWAAVILMVFGTAALFASGSPLQSDIVGYAKGGELLGGACIQIAYNAGNAIAAFIGGRVIASGAGYGAVSLVGIPLVALGAILVYILYFRYEKR